MPRDPDGNPTQILCIGRADANHEKLWQQLQQDGVAIAFARTQRLGLQMAWDLKPLVVVVNTANGAFTGDRLCRALGRGLPNVQRLLLTEAGVGANVPCERHLARPYTTARLRDVVTKLLEAADPHLLRAGALQLNLATRIITGPQGQQRLTPKQCSLLAYLMRRPNQVFSRRQLMKDVWDTPYTGDTRTLDVHIRWVREKIELDPEHPVVLVTKRGVGYLLAAPKPEPEPGDPLDGDAD
jgi:DNA-binding response OmpR family regulator